MKCCLCDKEIENEMNMIFINCDGDCVCNKQCEKEYEKDKAHFLDVIINDDILYGNWLYNSLGISYGELGL